MLIITYFSKVGDVDILDVLPILRSTSSYDVCSFVVRRSSGGSCMLLVLVDIYRVQTICKGPGADLLYGNAAVGNALPDGFPSFTFLCNGMEEA